MQAVAFELMMMGLVAALVGPLYEDSIDTVVVLVVAVVALCKNECSDTPSGRTDTGDVSCSGGPLGSGEVVGESARVGGSVWVVCAVGEDVRDSTDGAIGYESGDGSEAVAVVVSE